MFLWHLLSGRPAPLLAGILSGGARTFLPPGPEYPNRNGGRPSYLPLAMVQRTESRSHSYRRPSDHFNLSSRVYCPGPLGSRGDLSRLLSAIGIHGVTFAGHCDRAISGKKVRLSPNQSA